jgi:hypothetical protein
VRNFLGNHGQFAALLLKRLGKIASAPGSADGRKMELLWMVDQMLENARGRSVTLPILNY